VVSGTRCPALVRFALRRASTDGVVVQPVRSGGDAFEHELERRMLASEQWRGVLLFVPYLTSDAQAVRRGVISQNRWCDLPFWTRAIRRVKVPDAEKSRHPSLQPCHFTERLVCQPASGRAVLRPSGAPQPEEAM